MSSTTITYPHGVRLSRKPDARGYYRVRWTDGHEQRRDARRKDPREAQQLAERLSQGLEPGVDLDGSTHGATVADLIEHYLDPTTHDKVWSKSYRAANEGICRKWIRPQIGRLTLDQWSQRQTRAIMQAMRDEGLKESSRRRNLATIQMLAATGRRDGWMKHDPCADVKVAREEITIAGQSVDYVDPATIPSRAEIDKLAAAMVEVCGQWWRELQVLLSAMTGLRASEMLALTGNRINFEQGTINVDRQLELNDRTTCPPKGKKRRRTIFPAELDDMLSLRLDEVGGDLLFPGIDNVPELYTTFHNKRYRPAATACGWRRAGHRWHDLRHYFCTWALDPNDGLGLPVQDVALFAGHHSPSFTYDRYVGVFRRCVRTSP